MKKIIRTIKLTTRDKTSYFYLIHEAPSITISVISWNSVTRFLITVSIIRHLKYCLLLRLAFFLFYPYPFHAICIYIYIYIYIYVCISAGTCFVLPRPYQSGLGQQAQNLFIYFFFDSFKSIQWKLIKNNHSL